MRTISLNPTTQPNPTLFKRKKVLFRDMIIFICKRNDCNGTFMHLLGNYCINFVSNSFYKEIGFFINQCKTCFIKIQEIKRQFYSYADKSNKVFPFSTMIIFFLNFLKMLVLNEF